jgi:hypothetical protein
MTKDEIIQALADVQYHLPQTETSLAQECDRLSMLAVELLHREQLDDCHQCSGTGWNYGIRGHRGRNVILQAIHACHSCNRYGSDGDAAQEFNDVIVGDGVYVCVLMEREDV